MSVTRTLSNEFHFELGKGSINFSSGEFRVILMNSAFVFDRDAHGTYGDVSASELATDNGYTQISKVLVAESVWTQDNATDKAIIGWESATWLAEVGDIGPAIAAIVLAYDSVTPANSIIVGCVTFAEGVTVPVGINFQLQNMGFDLSQVV